jgi:hypothetical protein
VMMSPLRRSARPVQRATLFLPTLSLTHGVAR